MMSPQIEVGLMKMEVELMIVLRQGFHSLKFRLILCNMWICPSSVELPWKNCCSMREMSVHNLQPSFNEDGATTPHAKLTH